MNEKATILIVDDNGINRNVLNDLVLSLGYKPIQAANGRAALSIMNNEPPHIVLLDILMPEMDGYEVLKQMKSDKDLRNIPVVMITAVDDIAIAAKCITKGADDYLVIPFNTTLLKARIAGSLEKKRLYDENAKLLNKVLKQQEQAECELELAEKVQKTMLPSREYYQNFPQCDIEAYYRPTSLIGGDFYHFMKYGDNEVAFLIADVSGHGPAAALIVAAIKSIVENERDNSPPPAQLMRNLNRKLFSMIPEDHFATVFFCVGRLLHWLADIHRRSSPTLLSY